MSDISNEIKRKIFNTYSNCPVRYLSNELPFYIKYVTKNGVMIDNYSSICSFDSCKLILKPLIAYDITNKHAIKITELLFINRTGGVTGLSFSLADYARDYIYSGSVIPASVIDYLRDNEYDCGYEEIPSLIDAEVAINNNL